MTELDDVWVDPVDSPYPAGRPECSSLVFHMFAASFPGIIHARLEDVLSWDCEADLDLLQVLLPSGGVGHGIVSVHDKVTASTQSGISTASRNLALMCEVPVARFDNWVWSTLSFNRTQRDHTDTWHTFARHRGANSGKLFE